MLTQHTIFRSETVRISDYRCRPHDCGCGDDEVLPTHDITFPRSGVFTRHFGRREFPADTTRIAFFNRDEPYRVSHPVAGGDDGTIFNVRDDDLLDMLAEFDPGARDRRENPFPFRDASSSPSMYALHRRLFQYVKQDDVDPVAVDESVLALVARAVRAASEQTGCANVRIKPSTERAHRHLADDVRTMLNERFRSPLSLDDIARSVHSSAYHLARVFKSRTGLPVHQYLNRLRLRAALDRIADAPGHLTGVALDLGFSSHSHFADNFRREFGFAPSTFRRRANAATLRQMSKNLEA